MSVDAEITKINEGIAELHRALFKFDNQLDGILQTIDGKLTDFDNGFPGKAVYYSILVLILMMLNLSCLYMIYYIYQWIVERDLRFDKELRKYRKKVYRHLDEKR
ncbi:hypothetical protein GCK32_012364 [Trichostrongylus colubriformis]|uniref:Uncharacterized protein n=2 Tax=Trichostrongylus colubriformis TaxID=6319 RepID=A0AAN8F408_TRICO